jgi:hypothetical protein
VHVSGIAEDLSGRSDTPENETWGSDGPLRMVRIRVSEIVGRRIVLDRAPLDSRGYL